MGQKYNEIKSLLEEGQKVLFTGTPCQVNGLRAYLKKDYDNLFCLDFICHGVPSEKVWEKYCKEAEKLLGNKVTSVNFRNKKYSWERFGISFESNGKGKIFRSKAEDPYLRLFQKNYGLRPSCYQCQHKGIVRNSDITIGDFWGIRRVIPGFSDGCGVSLLLIHSPKGLRMFDEIRNDIVAEEVNTIKAVDNNVAALESVYQPYDNNTFWDNVNAMTVGKVADRFAPISKKEKIKIVAVKSPLYKVIKKHRKNAK
jgi:coenzyme F420-reducing hydrogenase beta subunit